MGNEGLDDIRRHTVVTSPNGWLKAWNKYRGIALNTEGWCDVRHGRLIMSSLIRLIPHVIHCHSDACASSAKYWITSSKFSLAIVHRVVMPRCRAKIIIEEYKLAKLLE